MRDDKLVEFNNLSPNMPPSITLSSYDLLVRQSKKLGFVATKAFHDIGRLLHQEIIIPPPGQLLEKLRQITKPEEEKDNDATSLKRKVQKSHQIIAVARTVFPLTLFPDSIVVDRTKVTIIKRDFFWSANVISFRIEDILNVSSSVGPFFGSLGIASRVMSTIDHFYINYLWRRDAMALKHIIQGYIIAKHNGIKTDHLTDQEMVETLSGLGVDSDKQTR